MNSGEGSVDPAAALRKNLAEGLHAAAQPLSVLRMGLDPQAAEARSAEELRRMTEKIAGEVERLCRIFGGLQQMVQVEADPKSRTSADLRQLVFGSVEDVRLYFDHTKIGLRCTYADAGLRVELEPRRIAQAITIVLLVAHEISLAGGTVDVTLNQTDTEAARLTICNQQMEVEKLDHEFRLQLALAETILRSQRFCFGYSLKPFAVEIEFATPPAA